MALVYERKSMDEKNGDAANIHPLATWDFHFPRSIVDSGFVDALYGDDPDMLKGYGG